MFRYSLVTLMALLISFCMYSQALYMPRNIKNTFERGSRSPDGRPGKNYWQNHASYNINITALPPDRTISGTEDITYVNNNPDSLRVISFKLFLNIHKAGAPRVSGVGPDYITDGITIDSFAVNGRPQNWRNDPTVFTNYRVRLRTPLPANDSIHFYIKWHYQVSKQDNREGMIDPTTFYLAYFYPRVAVNDDYQGWDHLDFNDLLEFYSDFNNYNVNITIPKNYICWGTGTLLNPAEVLQPDYLHKFQQSMTSDDIISIATPTDIASKNITIQNTTNTWKFKADNIPDMTFGVSDHFNWDASSIVVDEKTKRRASVQSAYNDTAKDFHFMVHFAKESLNYLSNEWPGLPYPYEKTTIFQGHADMEYPMMVNDGTTPDTTFSRFVVLHELAHTYMPFYMGINETTYGFMDEGWATTFEWLFNRAFMGNDAADKSYESFRVRQWINDASPDEDLPIITPGYTLGGSGLGNNEYGKPSLGYLAVKDFLGDDLFRKCLHEYMERWHGKHPIPWDFFNTFNDASGKDLNWFWNNWFFSNYYIDLRIKNVVKKGSGYNVSIQNIGGMAAPFDIVVTYTDNLTETFHQTPAVWQQDQKQTVVTVSTKKSVKSVSIEGGIFMDANENDNVWKSK